MMDLNTIWFILIGVLFTGYVLLDGFDLGVGALHLFVRSDEKRRVMLNSIGPVWDGNEVWLIAGGGALFAAFPNAYATVFSGFYLTFILLLFALIFRAVAIEFRGKQPMKWWRNLWDVSFAASSILASFLIGVTLGNLVWGISLSASGEFQGHFVNLIHPYSLLVGIASVILFMMHGANYIAIKTERTICERAREWAKRTYTLFFLCYLAVTVATFFFIPHMTIRMTQHPYLFLISFLNLLLIVNTRREISKEHNLRAFLSSCGIIFTLMVLLGIGMYPNLVVSNPNPEFSLNIYNAASSQKTLSIMLLIAAIGMPSVLAYTAMIYWIFRGKVKLDTSSY